LGNLTIAESFELKHENLKATNTRENPNAVSPVPHPVCAYAGQTLSATLKPLSWNAFALRPAVAQR
jgi:alpha-N-arabinofuranosidase